VEVGKVGKEEGKVLGRKRGRLVGGGSLNELGLKRRGGGGEKGWLCRKR